MVKDNRIDFQHITSSNVKPIPIYKQAKIKITDAIHYKLYHRSKVPYNFLKRLKDHQYSSLGYTQHHFSEKSSSAFQGDHQRNARNSKRLIMHSNASDSADFNGAINGSLPPTSKQKEFLTYLRKYPELLNKGFTTSNFEFPWISKINYWEKVKRENIFSVKFKPKILKDMLYLKNKVSNVLLLYMCTYLCQTSYNGVSKYFCLNDENDSTNYTIKNDLEQQKLKNVLRTQSDFLHSLDENMFLNISSTEEFLQNYMRNKYKRTNIHNCKRYAEKCIYFNPYIKDIKMNYESRNREEHVEEERSYCDIIISLIRACINDNTTLPNDASNFRDIEKNGLYSDKPLKLFDRIKKRETEIDYDEMNETIWFPTTDNITINEVENNTSIGQNLLSESFEGINPFKRRGEDGVIYIHGLFEMSGGECRVYPQTGRFEYKAAQLAIQHVNEKNIIDGYMLKMYHNDTKVSAVPVFDA